VKSKTSTQLAADHWEAYEQNWKDRIAREEAEKFADQRKRREAAEKKQKQERVRQELAQQELMLGAAYQLHGATPAEMQEVNGRMVLAGKSLLDDGFSVEAHVMELMKLRAGN
jgi:hypothetical protein